MKQYKHNEAYLDAVMASIVMDLKHEPKAVRELLLAFVPKNVLDDYIVPSDKKESEYES